MKSKTKTKYKYMDQCPRIHCGGQLVCVDEDGDLRCLLCARKPGDR